MSVKRIHLVSSDKADEGRREIVDIVVDVYPSEGNAPGLCGERNVCVQQRIMPGLFMPPWFSPFAGEIYLTNEEIELLHREVLGVTQGKITREQLRMGGGRDQLYAELHEMFPVLAEMVGTGTEANLVSAMNRPNSQRWRDILQVIRTACTIVMTEIADRYGDVTKMPSDT